MDDRYTTDEADNEPVETAIPADGLAEASTSTTIEAAEAQHPGLDTSAPAASEETPSGASELVLAQTPEEVEAQYVNRAGGAEPTEEGDANAEDEENAEESDAGITADEAATMTDPEDEDEDDEA